MPHPSDPDREAELSSFALPGRTQLDHLLDRARKGVVTSGELVVLGVESIQAMATF